MILYYYHYFWIKTHTSKWNMNDLVLFSGLFSKAICDSGSAFSETSFLHKGFLERAKTFSDKLTCTLPNGTINFDCMQAADLNNVLSSQQLNLSDEVCPYV